MFINPSGAFYDAIYTAGPGIFPLKSIERISVILDPSPLGFFSIRMPKISIKARTSANMPVSSGFEGCYTLLATSRCLPGPPWSLIVYVCISICLLEIRGIGGFGEYINKILEPSSLVSSISGSHHLGSFFILHSVFETIEKRVSWSIKGEVYSVLSVKEVDPKLPSLTHARKVWDFMSSN